MDRIAGRKGTGLARSTKRNSGSGSGPTTRSGTGQNPTSKPQAAPAPSSTDATPDAAKRGTTTPESATPSQPGPDQSRPAKPASSVDAQPEAAAADPKKPEETAKPTPATTAVDLGTTTRRDEKPADGKPVAAGAPPNVSRSGSDRPEATKSVKDEPTPASTPAAETWVHPDEVPDIAPTSERKDDAPSSSPAQPAPSRSSGFGAGFVGGLLATALGLGAGGWWLSQDRGEAETASRLSSLEQSIADLPPAADLTPLTEDVAQLRADTEGGLADLGARVETLRSDLTTRLDEIEIRLSEIERAPNEDGTLAEDAIARWQEDIDALRARLQAQADEIAAMADDASARLQEAEQSADQVEAEAAAVTARAQARAALAELEVALETGAPYLEPLDELRATAEAEVPQPLANAAETGVPSPTELAESYPNSARDALALARREGLSGEEGGRVTSFFRDAFQLRSTAAQEGDTVNAVLSRAEAAVRDGRVDAALTEIETLPQPVQDAMSDWTDAAQKRVEALAAVQSLSQTLTEN